jgi:hypothetical protein
MKSLLRKEEKQIRHLGFRKQIMPIVEKAMADFLLRISVNSSYVALGIYDIASESFYKHSIANFLEQITEHLSFPSDFSPYLKPYISDKFRNIVYSDSHELIIGSFYRYYSIRLQVLVHHGRFIDWPQKIGVSEDDLERITSHSLARFEAYFPMAAKKLMGNGPKDHESIFYQYSVGKEMAYRYKLENYKMREFLYQNEAVWQDIIDYLPKMKESYNIFTLVEKVFKSNFRRFWDSYLSDYMDTLTHWFFAGAFEGHKKDPSQCFWRDLEKRLERNEFIIRTAEPY